MKSQKGSVTVIALIMLLFLVILCGGWIIMMTQEKTNALSDAKQQQAWYAAEAGFKRAAVLLGQKEDTWEWTNNDASTFNKGTFDKKVDMKTLQISGSDLKDTADNPWYAVNVAEITTEKYTSYPTSGSQTYSITSVGEYMGERKIIKRSITLSASSGGGGGGGGGRLDLPGIFQSGGTVSVGYGVNNIQGDIYIADSSKLKDPRWSSPATANVASTAVGTLYTHIPDKYFLASNYSNLVTKQYVTAEGTAGANDSPLRVGLNESIYVDWPMQYQQLKDDGNGNSHYVYGVYDRYIIAGNNSTIFVHLNGTKNWQGVYEFNLTGINGNPGIIGPSSGKPLTLIFDNDVAINAVMSGNIMIIAKGKVYISNTGNTSGMIVLAANSDVDWYPAVKYAFISSGGNVMLKSSANYFYGQVIAKGNIDAEGSQLIYSDAIAKSGLFTLPEGMTE